MPAKTAGRITHVSLDNGKARGGKPDSFVTGLSARPAYLGDVIDIVGENRGSDHMCLWIIVKHGAENQDPFATGLSAIPDRQT